MNYPDMTEKILPAKIFKDPQGSLLCSEIDDSQFSEINFPYHPGFYEGILWFDVEIDKNVLEERQRYMFFFENRNIDFAEAFVKINGSWTLIGRTGKSINTKEMSLVSILSTIPLMDKIDGKKGIIHARIRLFSANGDPVTIKLLSTTRYMKVINRVLSQFSFSGGIGICIFFGLLLTGILLKDPAYLILALSALLYILRALHVKGSGPVFIWNFIASFPQSRKIEYILDGLEAVFLSFSGRYFIHKKTSAPFLSKVMGIFLELSIIEMILIVTVSSQTALHLTYLVISIVQKTILIAGLMKHVRRRDFDMQIIFIPWITVFAISIVLRTLLGLRNFFNLNIDESFKLNEYITSTIGFLMLTIPPLYSIGKRFNMRYQFVQGEYQTLETKFIEEEKKKQTVRSATKIITRSSSTVLNSAGILSKLNFSATNAEYIELIKTESARINDLLISIAVFEGQEQTLDSPILFFDFFNSCMVSVKHITSSRNAAISLTTAVANDTVISADPRILQNIIISFSCSIIINSKIDSKTSIYIEEEDDHFILTITSKLKWDSSDSVEKIYEKLNENTYFDFICELSKIYGGTVDMKVIDDKCRFKLKMKFKTMENEDQTSVVVKKTNFELSENSLRLLKDKKKTVMEDSIKNEEKTPDRDSADREKNSSNMATDSSIEEDKIQDPFDKFNLSTREKEIATLIAEGNSDKEIASRLNISAQTVATHNKKIFKKAGVHSRVELINKLR